MKEFITFEKYGIPGDREPLTLHANNPGLEITFYFHTQICRGTCLFASIQSLVFFTKGVMALSSTLGNAVHTALSFIPPRYVSTASDIP
jgi:hypothetical protein